MRLYTNLVYPQILGVCWSCDRPMPGPFPTPPPKAREKRPGDKVAIGPVAGHYKNPISPFGLGLNFLLFFWNRFLK